MTTTKSQKILQWTTKDVVLNIITYVANILLIAMLLVMAVHINSFTGSIDLNAYLSSITAIHFLILLILIIAVMAFYFFFEDRNFMKSAKRLVFCQLELISNLMGLKKHEEVEKIINNLLTNIKLLVEIA